MPAGQQYATNVPQTQLTGLINPTAPGFSVASSAGWPSTPFTAILDIGTSTQEPVDVTSIVGTTWTVTRAIDGTVGFTHQVGATVTHGDIGRDFREARTHMDASTGVHGLAGGSSVVGTTDVQTLSNKVFSGAINMGAGVWNGTGTFSENIIQSATYLSFAGASGANARVSRLMGAIASGPPVAGTWNTGDIIVETTYNAQWVCTAGGTPGTWTLLGGSAKLGVVNPTGASATINIPSWVNTIYGVFTARTDNATTGGFVNLRINSDTGSNYTWELVLANTATITGQNSAGTATSMHLGAKTAANDTANYFGSGSFWLPNAQNTSMFKSVHSTFNAVGSTTNGFSGTMGGTWLSTAAVTGITVLPDAGNFVTGSSITVYGMA